MKHNAKKQALLSGAALVIALAVLVALSIPDPLRLHIIANSDNPADQAVKLQVRNAVLEQMSGVLSQARTKQEALQLLMDNGQLLQQTAEQTLAVAGMDYGAQLSVGVSDFPDRTYGDTFYPAGKYEALRIVLGSGTGRNWWCVMYPPLCLGTLKPTGNVKFKSALLSLFTKGRQTS